MQSATFRRPACENRYASVQTECVARQNSVPCRGYGMATVDSRRGGDVAGCPGGAILISQLGQHGVFGLREIVNRVEPEEFQESIGRPVFVQFGRVVFFHAQ